MRNTENDQCPKCGSKELTAGPKSDWGDGQGSNDYTCVCGAKFSIATSTRCGWNNHVSLNLLTALEWDK